MDESNFIKKNYLEKKINIYNKLWNTVFIHYV